MASVGPGPKGLDKLEQFLQLPREVRVHIASYLSEKDAYSLVLANPALFLGNIRSMSKLAEKFYNYMYSREFKEILGEESRDWPRSQLILEVASRFFTPKQKKLEPFLFNILENGQKKYLTRLDFKVYSSEEVDLTIDQIPESNHVKEIIGGNMISAQLLRLLPKCPNLELLNLSEFLHPDSEPIEGVSLALAEIPPNSHLETLILAGSKINGDQLPLLLAKFPHLQNLDISNCLRIDSVNNQRSRDIHLPGDLDLSNLISLNASKSNISSNSVIQFLQRASSLRDLNLYDCPNLDAFILPDDLDLSSLRNLNVGHMHPKMLRLFQLLQKTTNLEILDLSYLLFHEGPGATFDLPDDFVLPSLRDLNMNHFDKYASTEDVVDFVQRVIPNLKHIDIRDCQQLAYFDFSAYPELQVTRY